MDKQQLGQVIQSCLSECKVDIQSTLAEVDSIFFISLLEEELGISLPDDFIGSTICPEQLAGKLSTYLDLD